MVAGARELLEAQRILVLGPCGAGKSTLAIELGRRLGLEVVHMDRLFWKPGWTESDDDEFAAKQEEAVQREAWICEGNYKSSLPLRLARADLVVYLDFPRRVFMPRLLRRIAGRRTRPDMTEGCEEFWDPRFLAYAWLFPGRERTRILRAVAESGTPRLDLRRPADVEALFAELPEGKADTGFSE